MASCWQIFQISKVLQEVLQVFWCVLCLHNQISLDYTVKTMIRKICFWLFVGEFFNGFVLKDLKS